MEIVKILKSSRVHHFILNTKTFAFKNIQLVVILIAVDFSNLVSTYIIKIDILYTIKCSYYSLTH